MHWSELEVVFTKSVHRKQDYLAARNFLAVGGAGVVTVLRVLGCVTAQADDILEDFSIFDSQGFLLKNDFHVHEVYTESQNDFWDVACFGVLVFWAYCAFPE